MNRFFLAFLLIVHFMPLQAQCNACLSYATVEYVNPFIGTGSSGNCVPAATSPFGMISWGPNTVFDDYAWYDARPGYKYNSDEIISFSLTHYSGIGCHATRDIPFTFTDRKPVKSPVTDREAYASTFSKSTEYASPGEYGVLLDEGNISVKMASAERSSIAVLQFDKAEGSVIIAPGNNANGVWDAFLEIDTENRLIKGYGGTGGFCDTPNTEHSYTVYFVAQFDADITDYGMWKNDILIDSKVAIQGDSIAAYMTFALSESPTLKIKTAISYVSIENAMLNLESEIPAWEYSAVLLSTRQKWNDVLSRIEITSSNPDDYEVFYTALYHNCLHPNIFEDVNCEYIGFDDEIHKVQEGRHFYVNFSLWDTYRTSAALQAMLFPDRMSDMLHAILHSSIQGEGMPVWTLNNTDNGCMGGFSAAPFVASAYAFGSRDIELETIKNRLIASALEYIPIKDSRGWSQIDEYKALGYVPHPFDRSVSKTAEYSIADYSIAQLCKASGDLANYRYFLDRSKSIFNLISPVNGSLQKKDANGHFVEPFDIAETIGFEEGNTAHYTFGVPHTPVLVEMLGGSTQTNEKLDKFFSTIYTDGWNTRKPHYWLGNEPCFSSPFVYNYTGRSWESQRLMKEFASFFTPNSEGLPGDDDAGAMSAYYMFGAMGIYPYIPGKGGFVITGPMFDHVTINLNNGKRINIEARNASLANPYIGKMTLNGQEWQSAWMDWELLEKGADLQFEMQDKPNTEWGAIKSY